ncbi:MAG: hypothetical protein D6795_05495 [Deltaproteobacteria bacterium]|nr:MAG: hypothetical protein D6795_05495 [Deltaproteobacteria bacterium]
MKPFHEGFSRFTRNERDSSTIPRHDGNSFGTEAEGILVLFRPRRSASTPILAWEGEDFLKRSDR